MVYKKKISETKNLINLAVVSGLAVTYTMLEQSLIKMRPADLDKLDFEDSAKLVDVIITASIVTKDFLVKQRIISENISM